MHCVQAGHDSNLTNTHINQYAAQIFSKVASSLLSLHSLIVSCPGTLVSSLWLVIFASQYHHPFVSANLHDWLFWLAVLGLNAIENQNSAE